MPRPAGSRAGRALPDRRGPPHRRPPPARAPRDPHGRPGLARRRGRRAGIAGDLLPRLPATGHGAQHQVDRVPGDQLRCVRLPAGARGADRGARSAGVAGRTRAAAAGHVRLFRCGDGRALSARSRRLPRRLDCDGAPAAKKNAGTRPAFSLRLRRLWPSSPRTRECRPRQIRPPASTAPARPGRCRARARTRSAAPWRRC